MFICPFLCENASWEDKFKILGQISLVTRERKRTRAKENISFPSNVPGERIDRKSHCADCLAMKKIEKIEGKLIPLERNAKAARGRNWERRRNQLAAWNSDELELSRHSPEKEIFLQKPPTISPSSCLAIFITFRAWKNYAYLRGRTFRLWNEGRNEKPKLGRMRRRVRTQGRKYLHID